MKKTWLHSEETTPDKAECLYHVHNNHNNTKGILTICDVIKQNESKVDSDMLLISDYIYI